jgi:hypothetical protein
MKARQLLSTVVATSAIAAAALPSAAGAAVSSQEAMSQNWSGYVAGDSSGSTQFSSVSGSWVQPSAKCTSSDSYSAFWVGLGGSGQSQSLEQTGTQADCVGGQTQYYAWYELVPSAPVKLDLAINPGDHISAKVTVNGTNVTVSLSDQTTGASATKTLQMDSPDTSSAEWIAEAPSSCDGSGSCQPLSLANFGTVNFSNATATANGHTGSINDSNWTAQPVQLSSAATSMGFASTDSSGAGSSAGAQPSGLSSDGSSFSVSWQSDSSSSSSSAGGSGAAAGASPGGGYSYDPGTSGYGSGYGYGGGYGYGSGNGYGTGYGYGPGTYLYGY